MFPRDQVIGLVEQFCSYRGVADRTRFSVFPDLAGARRVIELKGPDQRWATINGRGDFRDMPPAAPPVPTARAERVVFTAALHGESRPRRSPRWAEQRPWQFNPTVVSAAHWARLSITLREAYDLGLGWLLPAHNEVLLVPRPRLRFADDRRTVLHADTGEPAAQWADGTGYYFLRDTQFDAGLYAKVLAGELNLTEISALPNADQRSIALSYLGFGTLVRAAGARLVNRGQRGTSLYRLPLPSAIARDRSHGYGRFDYFIHMRDASHPEREFVEWVDPGVGASGDAELCQAQAFGISLAEWLSIEQEG